MEIITGEPRRRWSREQKLAAVAATFEPDATVAGVARQMGANTGMVFSWRKQSRAEPGFPELEREVSFAPVMLTGPSPPLAPRRATSIYVGHDRDCLRRRRAAEADRCSGARPCICGDQGADPAMIPVPVGVSVFLATGHTDMRRGFEGLALAVQEHLKMDPLPARSLCFAASPDWYTFAPTNGTNLLRH